MFYRAPIHPCFRRPYICPSRYLLSHWQNSTKLATSLPITVRVCESNTIFSCIRPSMRPLSNCPSRYLQNHRTEFNQTCDITSPVGKGAREQQYFSARPSSVHLSVTLSPPKPLGGIQPNLLHHLPMVRVYQNNSPHGKGVSEQQFFPECPSSVHLCIMLFPLKQ